MEVAKYVWRYWGGNLFLEKFIPIHDDDEEWRPVYDIATWQLPKWLTWL